MKTAVSIPDDVFERAERLARRAGRSRSEVFSAALAEYLARHAPDEVTDAMDRRMVIAQGEVWWAELTSPTDSEPGFRRPVVVVKGDALNRSRLATVGCVSLTSNLKWADAPGNALLSARSTGLQKDSVANVSQIVTIDRTLLTERAGKLSAAKLELLLSGIDVVLGR
jgi:mRNA interferase MazF